MLIIYLAIEWMHTCVNDSTPGLHVQAGNHRDSSWTLMVYSQALDKAGLSLRPEKLASANNQILIPENSDGAGEGAEAQRC